MGYGNRHTDFFLKRVQHLTHHRCAPVRSLALHYFISAAIQIQLVPILSKSLAYIGRKENSISGGKGQYELLWR